ncbi:Alanine racemase [hydrothermal vent metagenome]|uniref:alanine racemase n=1 Tax=hydrothermal vent metagenome TaxID=652676 RepID=A0A3B1AJB9_9ZZZZ
MSRVTRATINLTALKYNLAIVKKSAPPQKIMAVVKADAYGHGMARVAQALKEVLSEQDAFAVASIDEAVMLRAVGITNSIVVLEGFNSSADLTLIQQHNISVVIHHISQLILLELQAEQVKNIKCWLKIDTGMHRLGFAPDDVKKMYQRLLNTGVDTDIGLMTHLANADDRGDSKSEQQVELFNQIVSGNPAETSLANSAAILGWPTAHGHWVRPGIMLYGVNPFVYSTENEANKLAATLKPVMTLSAALIAINKISKDETIGYGSTWSCPEDMLVGVVSIGYGDGYPRHAPSGTPVLVNGKRAALIGRVSMDMIMVDLRQQTDVKVGDEVTLWGDGLPVEEIAAAADTIGYELLCGVTRRVVFEYKDSE